MALDAGPFMRTRTRGSPSWPTARRKAGYVCADCSGRTAEATCRRGGPYVCAGAMLMHPDDRAIDHRVLEIWSARQLLKDPVEHVLLRPTTEPLEDGVPVAIAVRQVPPRRTRSDHPKNGFEKLSIIRARAPRITDLARKQRRYPLPLLVAQTCPIQAGLRFPALNQSVARRGIPPTENNRKNYLRFDQRQSNRLTRKRSGNVNTP